MSTPDLIALIKACLLEHKAEELELIDLADASFAESMLVCSAMNTIHLRALTEHLVTLIKEHAADFTYDQVTISKDWAVLDMANLLIHIMLPETRSYYNLEALWHKKPASE